MEQNPIEVAQSMKKIDGKATLDDFSLRYVSWDNPTNDDLVSLYEYKQELFWENMIHTFITDERIPAEIWFASRVSLELGISTERLWDLVEQAMDIANPPSDDDDEVLTDEEVEEMLANDPELAKAVDELWQAIDKMRNRDNEVDELFQMWDKS